MRLIKLFLLSIFFLFLIVTGVSLMIPSHIRISKAVNIYTSKDSLFALIADTLKWKEWHPAFIPGDSTPKFPAVHIRLKTQNDSEIIMRLQQANKPEVINGWRIYSHSPADSLTLQWYMDFHLQWYPWQKFGSLFYENTYGMMMEKGLENLKSRVQQ